MSWSWKIKRLSSSSSPSNQYSKIVDEYICFVAQHATPKAISLDDVKTATVNDPTLQHLTKAIRTGNWTVTPTQRNIGVDPQEINAYFKLRNEITVSNENDLGLYTSEGNPNHSTSNTSLTCMRSHLPMMDIRVW
jgi:hypothetical protein